MIERARQSVNRVRLGTGNYFEAKRLVDEAAHWCDEGHEEGWTDAQWSADTRAVDALQEALSAATTTYTEGTS